MTKKVENPNQGGKGIPKSFEHRQKISESLRGNQNRTKQLKLFQDYEYRTPRYANSKQS